MAKLVWNVYYHDFNANEIKVFNIFKHSKFVEYIKKHKKKCETKEDFAEKVRRELFYYFGSKCEWETIFTNKDGRIIITPWVGRKEEAFMDITDDETVNWVDFHDWMAKTTYEKDGSVKVDVYSQVMYRFDEFVDFCWEIKRWIV